MRAVLNKLIRPINDFLSRHPKVEVTTSAAIFVGCYWLLVVIGSYIPSTETSIVTFVSARTWKFISFVFSALVIALIVKNFMKFVLDYYNNTISIDKFRTKISVGLFVLGSLIGVIGVYADLYMHSRLNAGNCNSQSFFDCFYLSFMTITTVGYGDCTPSDVFGKITSMLEAATGFVVFGFFVSSVSTIYGRTR